MLKCPARRRGAGFGLFGSRMYLRNNHNRVLKLQWDQLRQDYVPEDEGSVREAEARYIFSKSGPDTRALRAKRDTGNLFDETRKYWVLRFEQKLEAGNLGEAKQLLIRLSKTVTDSIQEEHRVINWSDQKIFEACFCEYISLYSTNILKMIAELESFSHEMGGRVPSVAIAYALHCCIKQNNREGVKNIVDLWTLKLSQPMRYVFRHSDVLPAIEASAIENILNGKDLLELSQDFYDPHGFSELRSCLAIVREPRLDVNKILGTNFGNDKYFEIYDKLDDKKKEVFDRAYEMFNRDRQRDIELFGLSPGEEHDKSVKDKYAISKLSWEWKDKLVNDLTAVMKLPSTRKKGSELKALKERLDLPEDTVSTLCEHKELISKIGVDGVAKIITQEMIMLSLSFLDTAKGDKYRISGRPFTSMARRLGGAIVSAAKVPEGMRGNSPSRDASKDAMRRQYTEMYWNRLVGAQKLDTVSLIRLGVAAINLCLDRLKLPVVNEFGETELKPAFWKGYERRGVKKYGHIYANESIVDIAIKDRSKVVDLVRSAYYLPMLVKPRPWTSSRDGGYLYADSTLLSSSVPVQTRFIQRAIEQGHMDDFLAGIDVISSTPWAVNDRVFRVVDELWNRGEGAGGIPSREDPAKKLATKRQRELHLGKLLERTAFGVALEVARAYSSNGDRFYFPHQIDFRGRAYPVCSAGLTYLGQESYRALFQFWHGKKLGDRGLRWLKIQLANMYGYDKVSNDDRERFTDSHMKDIMDSADRPLEGEQWWMNGDKPFQVLAACFEIADAMRSPDPRQYVSRIPVNQDGSCNGLQHYAALGGDTAGARQVNMLPAKSPGDIYSQIAKSVNELIDQDCRNGMAGVDQRFHEIAPIINGRIVRKVVKQSVMTTVYGVTEYGAMLQVKKQLELIPELPREMYGLAASYISGKIFEARTLMFKGASQLQDWLVDGAARICESTRLDVYKNALKPARDADPLRVLEPTKAFTTGVVWTTPLGLPVVQPYAEEETMVVNIDSHYLTLSKGSTGSMPVNKHKQKNGVAPNFVHSLDATHMLMTARECSRRGISFASVHDSYWTHAANVDELGRTLREQFVALYSVDQIERLRDEWMERYDGFLNLGSVTPDMKSYGEIEEYRKKYGRKSINAILLDELEAEYRTWLRKRAGKKYLNMPATPTRYLRKHRERPVALTTKTLKVLYPITFPKPPKRGDYETISVLDSEYFFS